MVSLSRIVGVLSATAILACLLACGATQKVREAADRQKRSNDLKQIALELANYHDANGKFPADQQAFLRGADPVVTSLVQGGQYTVLYGEVRMADLTEGTSNTVVAYENQTRGGNRLVATADGNVVLMPEAEFALKPRLKPKPAGGAPLPDQQKRTNELKAIVFAMHNYENATGKFPADQQTFVQWVQKSQPQVVQYLQSGQYTVLFAGVRLVELVEGTSNTVVAYDNQMAGGNRLVATADGNVRLMPEAEFAAKPRLRSNK